MSVPCGKCPSELQAEAGLDKQALVQRPGSHIGLHMESGGSPSGSRKGFIDKTRVISLSDSGLGKETKSIALYYTHPFLTYRIRHKHKPDLGRKHFGIYIKPDHNNLSFNSEKRRHTCL